MLSQTDNLVERINTAHQACEAAAHVAVKHALEAGALLAEAKQTVAHGGWLPWITANCKFSARTAQVYLKLHENRDRLESKAQSTAHLSIASAVKLLAKPTTKYPSDADLLLPDIIRLESAEIDHLLPAVGMKHWLLAVTHELCEIVPHVQDGYFFVTAFVRDCSGTISEANGGKRAMNAGGVRVFLQIVKKEHNVDFMDPAVCVSAEASERWDFNHSLYGSATEYLETEKARWERERLAKSPARQILHA